MELDYERDVAIDPDRLDVEWLQQSKLMFDYAKAVALAQRDVDDAKEMLELVKAKVELEIRADPGTFGLAKPTDAAVAAAVLNDKRYMDVSRAFIDAKYEVNMARAASSAIDGKKTALENLVRLFGQQYFAGPKVPRDISREWKTWEAEQRSREFNSSIKMSRRK